MQNFDRQPAASRAEITALLERDRKGFYDGAIRVAKNGGPARGVQLVAALLVQGDLIGQALTERALSLEQAIGLGKLALQSEATLDTELARQLSEDVSTGGDSHRATRLLDVLSAISSGNRIATFLMRLMRHSDPTLRSKAVLLIGRSSRSVKWVQSRLGESDPRTRASAVEGLWGVESVEARDLLRVAACDGNNRVAGNALIALFRMGDSWMIPEVYKMVAAGSALFRASGAWVMGETGDPRFKESLARLLGESDAMVRRRAFLALSRLKAASQARQGREWRVAGRIIPSGGNWRQVRVEIGVTDGSTPRLLPTNFALAEDGRPVMQYQIEERPSQEALALSFLLPRTPSGPGTPWTQGANAALQWKRPSDLWQPAFYLTRKEATEDTAEGDEPRPFLTDRDAIAAALAQPAAKLGCTGFWSTLRQSANPANAPARGARHLIAVVAEEIEDPPELSALISAAMNSKTVVHAITRAAAPALEDLCRRTQGAYVTAASDLELPSMIEETHLAILARFHISYLPPAPGGSLLTVKVCNTTGFGEGLLTLA